MQQPRSLVGRVLDYWRREGPRALAGRMVQELVQRRPALERVVPGLAVLGHLDLPVEDSPESSAVLRVVGWAWSHGGVESVDLSIDGDFVLTASTGLHRPDVAASIPWDATSVTSGFSADIPISELPSGPHELSLHLRDRNGRTRTMAQRFTRVAADALYHAWYEQGLPTDGEISESMRIASDAAGPPRCLVLIDAEGEGDISATLRSIVAQGYPGVRCRILASRPRQGWIEEQVTGLAPSDLEIQIGDQMAWPAAEDQDTAGFFCALRPGEELAPGALWLFAARALTCDADIIYSDHDEAMWSGRHVAPSFKPDWSPDHLLSRDYVGGSYIVRDCAALRELLEDSLSDRNPAWRYDLLLRATDGVAKVDHIPRILWTMPESHRLSNDGYAHETAAVGAAVERRGGRATVSETERAGVRHVQWEALERPKVSIIIPTTGRIDHLKPCLDSLREKTHYGAYEVLIIDNGRGRHRDGIEYARSLGYRILTRDEPFNWAKLNDDGVRETDGPLLLFLNDDVEIVQEGWLTELVGQAIRPDVGAVGCMLLYPDGLIQHAGVVLVGHGGGAMHLLHRLDSSKPIYGELDAVTREVSANTGACLMMRRELFAELGGFDEELAVAGNDLDLCLRLMSRGYRNIWTPHSVLVHHESVSRGPMAIDVDERGIQDRWGSLLKVGDPYSNPNLDRRRSDCSIDWSRLPRPSASGDVTPGIDLIGYIRAEMGVGEGARGNAHALARAGLPFSIIDYSAGNPARMGDDSWLHKVTMSGRHDINLIHVNAAHVTTVIEALPDVITRDKYNIGYWAWEMPEFPDKWLGAFDLVDEVWAPSTYVQEAISRKSPVPVVHVPHPISIPHGPFLPRKHFGLHDGAFHFLAMYDVHSIRERKNPDGAVRAFREAFAPDDEGVALLIKINGAGAEGDRAVSEWTDGYPNIRIIDRTLDRHEVHSLMARTDCFVSLHRAEGFGLPIAEAMGLGKPVIATHWSGNVDFMDAENAACIDYKLVTLERDHGPYAAGQHWADPDVAQASWWMRRLREDEALAQRLGARARQTVATMLSADAVGRRIAARVDQIRQEGSLRRGT